MEFVSTNGDRATQVEAFVEQSERQPLSALVGFLFSHEQFNLLCDQATDRGGTTGCENLRFLNRSSIDADRHILLVAAFVGCHERSPRILRDVDVPSVNDDLFRPIEVPINRGSGVWKG